jgi:hypothetical protein
VELGGGEISGITTSPPDCGELAAQVPTDIADVGVGHNKGQWGPQQWSQYTLAMRNVNGRFTTSSCRHVKASGPSARSLLDHGFELSLRVRGFFGVLLLHLLLLQLLLLLLVSPLFILPYDWQTA